MLDHSATTASKICTLVFKFSDIFALIFGIQTRAKSPFLKIHECGCPQELHCGRIYSFAQGLILPTKKIGKISRIRIRFLIFGKFYSIKNSWILFSEIWPASVLLREQLFNLCFHKESTQKDY